MWFLQQQELACVWWPKIFRCFSQPEGCGYLLFFIVTPSPQGKTFSEGYRQPVTNQRENLAEKNNGTDLF
jgi:hypothetical protein